MWPNSLFDSHRRSGVISLPLVVTHCRFVSMIELCVHETLLLTLVRCVIAGASPGLQF